MFKTDCGRKVDIVFEAKLRTKDEMQEDHISFTGEHPVLAYQEAFINAEVDGKLLKGMRCVVLFEK